MRTQRYAPTGVDGWDPRSTRTRLSQAQKQGTDLTSHSSPAVNFPTTGPPPTDSSLRDASIGIGKRMNFSTSVPTTAEGAALAALYASTAAVYSHGLVRVNHDGVEEASVELLHTTTDSQ
jgi:hypothetical protein